MLVPTSQFFLKLLCMYVRIIIIYYEHTCTYIILLLFIKYIHTYTGWSVRTGSCRRRSRERDSSIVQISRGSEEERAGVTRAEETTRSYGEGERRNGCHMGNGYVCMYVCPSYVCTYLIRMDVRIYPVQYTCIRRFACVCVCVSVCMCMCLYVYVCVYM